MIRLTRMLSLSLAVAALSLLGACAPAENEAAPPAAETTAEADEGAMRQGIDETNRAAEQAVAAGNVAGFVQRVYTDDAVILPPDAPSISGHADIEAFWSSAAQQLGMTGLQLQTDDLVPLGPDRAYEIGTAVVETPQGNPEFKYVVIWQRGEDGLWRWDVDIWNNAPAAGPQPAA